MVTKEQGAMTRRGFLGRAIGGAAGIGAVALGSRRARAGVDMREVLDSILFKENKEWTPYIDCRFQGPEFDSNEVFSNFRINDAEATREDFRETFVEENGVLTMKADAGKKYSFGVDERDGAQRVSAYFNPESLKNGSGFVSIKLANESLEDITGLYAIINNTAYRPQVFEVMLAYKGDVYLPFESPYSGEAVRFTKDESGETLLEWGSQEDWRPILSTSILAGIPCSASITPVFGNSQFNPEMNGLTFDRLRHPEDVNEDENNDDCDIPWGCQGHL